MYNVIGIGKQEKPTYAFGKHTHGVWEVTYYTEGCGVNVTDGVEYPFTAGTIICQPPHIEHEDASQTGYTNIFYSVAALTGFDRTTVLHDTPAQDFLHILRQLYVEFYADGDRALIVNGLADVLHRYLLFLRREHDRGNVYVDGLKRTLAAHLSDSDFDVGAEAEKIPLCPDHLRRVFKRETGLAPLGYLLRLRVEHAQSLLIHSTLSVTDIAHMSGFDDPYYFSRLFKKHTGVSPSEYRQRKP